MDRNAALPDRCVKCNEPADGYRRTVKLTYVPLGTHLMLGAAIAYAFAKRATVEVGLCERHRRSRSMTVALVSVAAVVLSILAFTQVQATDALVPLLAAAGLIGGVIGLIYATFARRAVQATKITDTHVWLKGAGEPFLASLPDAPPASAGGALPTIEPAATVPADPVVAANAAFQDARNGALTFLLGCVVTAGSYAFLSGRYFIVWGVVLFGLIRLVRGLRTYVGVPAEHRNMGQVLMLVGIVGAGLIAGGWVITSEVTTQTQANEFDSALTTAGTFQTQGAALFGDVLNRTGAWTAQDAADMRKVASFYGQAADTLAASPAPAEHVWYRDGLVRNYHEAVDIATQFATLTSASSQSAFDALFARWKARVDDLKQLQARLNARPTPTR
jgi:hypothetical protein